MSSTKVTQVANTSIEVKQKLKVDEYVVEINNEDIGKVEISYYFDKIKYTIFDNGQKDKEYYKDVVFIDVYGVNKDNHDAGFSFAVMLSLKELNEYNDVPNDISRYIHEGEAFLKTPKESTGFFHLEFQKNNPEEIYKNLSSFWISKIATNVFIFKVCVPYDNVFAYFKVDFNKVNL